MRSDLDNACVTCKLRLPATDPNCARCGGALVPVADALRTLRERPAPDAWLDVPRTFALYVPAALGLLLSVVVSGFFLWDVVIDEASWSWNALGVGLGILMGVCFLGLWCLLLALPWFLWAGLVSLAFFIYREFRYKPAPPPLLFVLPLPAPVRPSFVGRAAARLGDLHAWLDAWHTGKRKPRFRVPLLVLVAAMVIAEITATKPEVEFTSLKAFANSAGPLLVMIIPIAVLAPIAILLPFLVAIRSADRLAAALRVLDGRRRARVGENPSLEPLRAARTRARGRASRGPRPLLTAPLSGKPCLAFRLVGTLDDLAIDDGDAIPMTLVDGPEEVEVRGERFAISLEGPGETSRALSPEPAARIVQFLAARGVSVQPRITDLREICVHEGDEIEAWGTARQERSAGEGYRDVVLGRVLDDGDGLPVLITR